MEATLHSTSPDVFLQSRNYHLALTQYFRWFQVYERPFNETRINNQLEILSHDIVVVSAINTIRGQDEYKERLKIHEGSMNAHHVKNIEVKQMNKSTLQVNAQVLYQGVTKNEEKTNSYINYQTLLSLRDHEFPKFTQVNLTIQDQADVDNFNESYAFNRAMSLMHCWLYNMESPRRHSEKFREFLTEDFELELSGTQKINQWEQLTNWIDNIDKRIKYSAHFERNFSVEENTNGTYTMNVEFDWRGLSQDNQPMAASTHHTWILENDPNERFARIQKMLVRQLTPFHIVE